MKKVLKVVLTGGGSGGHIIPVHSVLAALIDEREVEALYIGEKYSMEERLARQQHVPFRSIRAGKLRRYFSLQNIVDIFKVFLGCVQSLFILLRFQPDVVFAKGGYVTVPVGVAAWLLRIPLVIHESDMSLGLSNRILLRCARKLCTSFPSTLKGHKKVVYTGSPVRKTLFPYSKTEKLAWQKTAYAITGFTMKLPVIFVLGGSLGAQHLSEKIYDMVPRFAGKAQFVLQTGSGKLNTDYPDYEHFCQFEFLSAQQLAYMYECADIVIARAGAGTLFELASLKKASILVPLPRSQSRGDQIDNAQFFEEANAACIHDDQASTAELEKLIYKLLGDPSYRKRLEHNIIQFSSRNASQKIAQVVLGECD